MALYSGQDGQMLVNGTEAAKVRSWSFTANQAVLDTTYLESTDRTLLGGIRSITGSCSIFYYQTSAGSGTPDGGVSTFIDAFIKDGADNPGTGGDDKAAKSAQVKLRLRIADGSSNGRFIEFNTFITSLAMTSSVGEVMSADISFEANGAPTRVQL